MSRKKKKKRNLKKLFKFLLLEISGERGGPPNLRKKKEKMHQPGKSRIRVGVSRRSQDFPAIGLTFLDKRVGDSAEGLYKWTEGRLAAWAGGKPPSSHLLDQKGKKERFSKKRTSRKRELIAESSAKRRELVRLVVVV